MYIIGSITGFKYHENTDIDINVHVEPYDHETIGKTRLTHATNGFMSYGGRHPVNFFIKKYREGATWQDSYFGVYDVWNDKWLVSPPARETVRDPKKEFRDEIIHAKMVARVFNRHAQEFKKDLKALKRLKTAPNTTWLRNWYTERKRREIQEDFRELIEIVNNIEEGRKGVYGLGWGIPRTSLANVVYKFIANGPYGKLFHTLEPLKENATLQL